MFGMIYACFFDVGVQYFQNKRFSNKKRFFKIISFNPGNYLGTKSLVPKRHLCIMYIEFSENC
jgi:hypothetical protein